MIRPEYDETLFPHWCQIPIRYRDLDPLNHVNNAIYSTYYEEARIRFIRELPSFVEQLEQGFSFVLRNLQIDFIKPAEYPADMLIGSGIKSTGNTSITSFQAAYHSRHKILLSVAEATGVWFHVAGRRPAPLPEIGKNANFMLDPKFFELPEH